MITTSKVEDTTLVTDEANADPEKCQKTMHSWFGGTSSSLKNLLQSRRKARIKFELCKTELLKNGRPPP